MLIDEKGTKSILKWFQEEKNDTIFCLKIIDENPTIETKNLQEFATMKILLAKNNIKFELCEIKNNKN